MKHDDQKPDAPAAMGQRRPYASPAIEETSEFETLALTCAVAEGACGSGPYDPHPPGYYDQS
jgi:hypothetical protein